MGTFSLPIDDWNTDPGPAIAELTRQEEKCGFLAAHAYGMLRALSTQLELGSATISGGVLELPDGTDSIAITFSMHTGHSELSYRDRVLKYLKEGPGYAEGHAGVHGPAHQPVRRGGDAPDQPADVPPLGGDARTGAADPGTERRVGPGDHQADRQDEMT